MNRKTVALLLALVLVFGAAVGGTLAWLTDKTDAVTNTFTVGNIDIDLTEEDDDFKMVPGAEIDKDPIVTVKANSEACWVFVKVTESTNLDSFISYEIITTGDKAWTALEGVDGVYYQKVANAATDVKLPVLVGDKVKVLDTVTKEMLDGLYKVGQDGKRTDEIDESKLPTLTFQAYAVQEDGFATAALAWAEASKATT